jgi:hypothetical protein
MMMKKRKGECGAPVFFFMENTSLYAAVRAFFPDQKREKIEKIFRATGSLPQGKSDSRL